MWDIQTGACVKTLSIPTLYEGMNLIRVRGLTETTLSTFWALGAVKSEKEIRYT